MMDLCKGSAGPGHRRYRPFAILILVLFAASFSTSNAAQMSAQDLLTACAGDGVAKATCNGYLMAITDFVLQREGRGRGNARTCVPDTATVDQVRDAVLNVAQRRAERAQSGIRLVAAAMRVTWPCDAPPTAPPDAAAKPQ
jgi:hypothetical protein